MKKIIILLLCVFTCTIINAQTNAPFPELFPPTPSFFWGPTPPVDAKKKVATSADFNNDGYKDIALTGGSFFSSGNTWLAIYLGDCSGSLNAVHDTIEIPDMTIAWGIETADFNNDTYLDIVIGGDSTIAYLQGSANGNFAPPVFTPIPATAIGFPYFEMAVADFNNDSYKDIYLNIADYIDISTQPESFLMWGSTSGIFTNGSQTMAPERGFCVARDFDGDSFVDILNQSGNLWLNTNGVFAYLPVYAFQGGLNANIGLEVVNADADSLLEVYAGRDSSILYGQIDTNNIVPANELNLGHPIISFTVNDFDNDGFKDDVAVLLANDSVVYLREDFGVLTKQSGKGFVLVDDTYLLSTDINEDNNPEIFTPFYKQVWRNMSRFAFTKNNTIPIKGNFGYSTAADFDNDGYQDYALYAKVTTSSLQVIFGAPCGIREIRELGTGVGFGAGFELKAAKLNNDSFPDLILSTTIYDTIYVYLNNGSGSFLPRTAYYVGHNQQQLAIADFNEDGLDDVFMLSTSPGRFNICTANASGNGTLNAATPLQVSAPGGFNVLTEDPEVGDLNNDGNLDVIVSHDNALGMRMSTIYGDGNGGFPDALIQANSYGTMVNYCVPLHLNNDGYLDVLASNSFSGISYLFCRDSATNAWSNCQPTNLLYAMKSIGVADFNNDSISDFVANAFSQQSGYSTVNMVKPDYTVLNMPYFYTGYNKSSIADFDGDGKADLGWGLNSGFMIFKNDLPPSPMIVLQNDTIVVTAMRSSSQAATPVSYEWFKDHVLISGANQTFFPNPAPGLYHAGITYSNGAYATASIIILPVGLPETQKENVFYVSPNPANDYLTIKGNEVIEYINIFSVDGQQIYTSGNLTNNKEVTLSVTEIPQGVYLIHLSANGKTCYRKFVKM